ncbi:MAG: FMN-binding protein, partial [Gammaproteobacteria bacterium]|nr:FMN-binding protein [Gammaproteobacteria bacterium]
GYILPLKAGSASANQLVTIDLQGKFAGSFDLQIPPEKLGDIGERDIALAAALPGDMSATFADEVIVVNDGAQRRAYLLPGSFPGFKTFIKVFLALDPQLAVLGYEIVEQEEDPGLGDEIKKDYFKNQFAGKTLEQMKSIKVIKVPLPDEYRRYLERNLKGIRMSEEEIAAIREKYGDVDIHALTGATISSEAVSNGLKSMLKKFAYRLRILDEVVNRQAIPVAF